MIDVIDTICSGLVYLLGKQNAKGQWLDFNLPRGPREIWVTAYVGDSLTYAGKVVSDDGLRESLSKAADWIVKNMNNDFGWGYNTRTVTDADSTGHSIIFLASLGRQVDDGSFNRLMDFQKHDGGFCTYLVGDESNSWGDSHPDITPVALMALLNKIKPDNDVVRRGATYVLDHRGADGLWQSFWTNTFLYSTAANLLSLIHISEPTRPY